MFIYISKENEREIFPLMVFRIFVSIFFQLSSWNLSDFMAIDESERSSRNSRRSNDPALYSSKEREAKHNRYRYAAI